MGLGQKALANFVLCVTIMATCKCQNQDLDQTAELTITVTSVNECIWTNRSLKMECVQARLDFFLPQLNVPRNTRTLTFKLTHLNDANLIKEQILSSLSDLENLDLSYNELQELPPNFLDANAKLKTVNLRNNKIVHIPPKMFQFAPNLEYFDASNNQVVGLDPGMFQNCRKLKTLQLWANNIAVIPDDIFSNNPRLESVSLSWNRLMFLPEQLFKKAVALRSFSLIKNKIQCLPRTLFHGNPDLRLVNFGFNPIQILPAGLFKHNPNLKAARFWANRLRCLSTDLFAENSKISEVNFLMGNGGLAWQLRRRFSDRSAYPNMHNLKDRLRRFGNDSCVLQNCDWDPQSMTMDCSHRNLTTVENLLSTCERVRHLKLNGNRLNDPGQIEPIVSHMEDLRTLELQDNDLGGELTESMLSKGSRLAMVDVSQNKLSGVDPAAFKSNALLQRVNLRQNNIQSLPSRLFERNLHIEHVDISRNELEKLPQEIFSENSLLEVVKVSQNKLKTMERLTFKNNQKLKEVDISYNNLEGELPIDTIGDSVDLETFKAEGNRLQGVTTALERNTTGTRSREISLSDNNLRRVPSELLELKPTTQVLRLDRNDIAEVGVDAFASGLDLTLIDLSNNRIATLHNGTFARNTMLQDLILDGNAIATLPAELLRQNAALRTFSASGNLIRRIPSGFFRQNTALREVRLGDNLIAESGLPSELFYHTPLLRYVSFSGNRLTRLPNFIFQKAAQLSHIYLGENDLREIGPDAFRTPSRPADDPVPRSNREGLDLDESAIDNLLGIVQSLQESGLNATSIHETINNLVRHLRLINLRGNPQLEKQGVARLFQGKQKIEEFVNMITDKNKVS